MVVKRLIGHFRYWQDKTEEKRSPTCWSGLLPLTSRSNLTVFLLSQTLAPGQTDCTSKPPLKRFFVFIHQDERMRDDHKEWTDWGCRDLNWVRIWPTVKLIANSVNERERVNQKKSCLRLISVFCRIDNHVHFFFRIGLKTERENDVRPLTTSNLELVDK